MKKITQAQMITARNLRDMGATQQEAAKQSGINQKYLVYLEKNNYSFSKALDEYQEAQEINYILKVLRDNDGVVK